MNKRLCILIHHHHLAFIDENENIWLSSVLGRWVDAIAEQVEEVRLLLYVSNHRVAEQDTCIRQSNVTLYSLGPRYRMPVSYLHRKQIRKVCNIASQDADGLVIRGITPHQQLIWQYSPVKNKAYILVGDINQRKLQKFHLTIEALQLLIQRIRIYELQKMANKDTLFLANSPQVVSELEKLLDRSAVFVPTNSLRNDEVIPSQVKSLHNPYHLLYCGRLDINKGLIELLHALSELRKNSEFYQLDIVGQGQESIVGELKCLANELQINNMVKWHGFVPYGKQLFDYYQKADILVLPSYSEGFPHVIWEAMANSCPVITTSVGGIPALIQHNEHALLIPPKNPDAIREAIERLINDNQLREHLVKQGELLVKTYTVEACANRLVNVLNQNWLFV